jgi:hypothetical protein
MRQEEKHMTKRSRTLERGWGRGRGAIVMALLLALFCGSASARSPIALSSVLLQVYGPGVRKLPCLDFVNALSQIGGGDPVSDEAAEALALAEENFWIFCAAVDEGADGSVMPIRLFEDIVEVVVPDIEWERTHLEINGAPIGEPFGTGAIAVVDGERYHLQYFRPFRLILLLALDKDLGVSPIAN